MKASQIKQVLKLSIPAKEPILITGAPGIGKTDIVKSVCSEIGADLIVVHPVVEDPTNSKGMPWVHIEDGVTKADWVPFGDLLKIMQAEKLTVFFMDDLGQAAPSVQAGYMQLILARELAGKKVSDHVCFIAASNRKQDRAGVSGILEPVKSRFVSIIELDVDVDEWVAWALDAGVVTSLISFIRFRPNLLMDFKPSVDMNNSPSPRTNHNISKIQKMCNGVAPEILYELFKGAAGEGHAIEYSSFLEIYKDLPSPDVALLNPETVKLPDESKPAVLYAFCGAMARKCSQQTIGAIVIVANRLPDEFSVMMIRDCMTVDRSIVNSRAYISWASAHVDVLI